MSGSVRGKQEGATHRCFLRSTVRRRPRQSSGRALAARPPRPAALNARCRWWGLFFFIHRSCFRGHVYCSTECRRDARRRFERRARQRHRRSSEGRADHRDAGVRAAVTAPSSSPLLRRDAARAATCSSGSKPSPATCGGTTPATQRPPCFSRPAFPSRRSREFSATPTQPCVRPKRFGPQPSL